MLEVLTGVWLFQNLRFTIWNMNPLQILITYQHMMTVNPTFQVHLNITIPWILIRIVLCLLTNPISLYYHYQKIFYLPNYLNLYQEVLLNLQVVNYLLKRQRIQILHIPKDQRTNIFWCHHFFVRGSLCDYPLLYMKQDIIHCYFTTTKVASVADSCTKFITNNSIPTEKIFQAVQITIQNS